MSTDIQLTSIIDSLPVILSVQSVECSYPDLFTVSANMTLNNSASKIANSTPNEASIRFYSKGSNHLLFIQTFIFGYKLMIRKSQVW